jgi:hypothetical protein
LLAAVSTRGFIDTVWKTKRAGLLVRNHIHILQSVVASAVFGVRTGVAHSD